MSNSPFDESRVFDLDSRAAYNSSGVKIRQEDSFYTTGSSESIGDDASFARPLSSMDKIDLTFKVKNPVSMPGNSSSIYYFSPNDGQWLAPAPELIVGPFSKFSVTTRVNGTIINKGSRHIEDAIGFDEQGFTVTSGSQHIFRNLSGSQSVAPVGNQTSDIFCITFKPRDQVSYMTNRFPSGMQNNFAFDAKDSVFKLPIDAPFLVQKAVFEIPLSLGPSWFRDKTVMITSGCTSEDGKFKINGSTPASPNPGVQTTRTQDSGGPGITVALMCQKKYGDKSIRDLITKSFFTHSGDLNRTVSIGPGIPGTYGDDPVTWQYRAHVTGLDGGVAPDFVLTTPGSLNFTGSIRLKSTPATTNGIKIWINRDIRCNGGTHTTLAAALDDSMKRFEQFLSDELIENVGSEVASEVIGVDPFGKGCTGFAQSGGSIFGREHVAIDFSKPLKNPFYVPEPTRSTTLSQWRTKFETEGRVEPNGIYFIAGIRFCSQLYITGSIESPYLVRPGEELILSISKKRPALCNTSINVVSSSGTGVTNFDKGLAYLLSSSFYNDIKNPLGHDVTLNTGSIKVTLYGSYVSLNKGYVP